MKKLLSVFLLCLLSFAAHAQTAAAVKDTVDKWYQADKKYPFPTIKDRAYALRYVVDWVAATAGGGGGGDVTLAGNNTFTGTNTFPSLRVLNPTPSATQLTLGDDIGFDRLSKLYFGNFGDYYRFQIANAVTSYTDPWPAILTTGNGASAPYNQFGRLLIVGRATDDSNGDIEFLLGSARSRAMKIFASGRVAVGTTTDDGVSLLNVAGTTKTTDLNVTGTITNSALTTTLADKASLSGSYANPSWITSLPFTKLTGTATVSQIGTGTPGAGKYVDGATGAWTTIPTGGAVAWGTITGTLSSQTDLNSALGLKAPLASPTFTGTVSGITKAMVGLGNADNTSDATKNAATATLTNKTISGASNTLTNIPQSAVTSLATDLADKASISASYANPSWITSLPFTKITGTATTAQIGTGTPGAGKYVDGATGAWTDLPAGGGGASTSSANTWTARQTFSDSIRVGLVKANSTNGITYYSSIGTVWGKWHNTGRLSIGNTTDDGVSALNVTGRIKTSVGLDITAVDYTNAISLNGGQILTTYGNRTIFKALNPGGGLIISPTNYLYGIVLQVLNDRVVINGGGDNNTGVQSAKAALTLAQQDKLFLPNRLTAAQATTLAPGTSEEGGIVYILDTNGTFTTKGWYGWNGSAWEKLNN